MSLGGLMLCWRRFAFPAVTSLRSTDCGPASVASVADYFGLRTDLATLRTWSHTGRHGTELGELTAAAIRAGFIAESGRIAADSLIAVSLPVVCHVRTPLGDGHYVVLYELGPERCVVADPIVGLEYWPRRSFDERWTGYVLLLRPQATRSLARRVADRVVARLSPISGRVVAAVTHGVTIAASRLFLYSFVALAVDALLGRTRLLFGLAAAVALCLSLAVETFWGAIVQRELARNQSRTVLSRTRRLLRLRISDWLAVPAGDRLEYLRDASAVNAAVNDRQWVAREIVAVWGVIIVLSLVSFSLGALSAGFALLMQGGAAVWAPRSPAPTRREHHQFATAFRVLAEGVEHFPLFKGLRVETALYRRFASLYSAYGAAAGARQGASLRREHRAVAASTATTCLWAVLVVRQLSTGALTSGQCVELLMLLDWIRQTATRLGSLIEASSERRAAQRRLEDAAAVPLTRVSSAETVSRLRLLDVHWMRSDGLPVIEGVTFDIAPGESIGIVGASGSGKSVLASLICGHRSPTRGLISLGGDDVSGGQSCAGRIMLAGAAPVLLEASVACNIRPAGGAAVGDAELADAIAVFGLDRCIRALPSQLHTDLTIYDEWLSEGERQRLALLRASLARPLLLVLDDPLPNVDDDIERRILEWCVSDCRRRGHGLVVLSKRMTMKGIVGRLLTLQDGQCVAFGTERSTHDCIRDMRDGGRAAVRGV